ncbi:MAG: LamG domain-containing protein, partial [Polyangiaceae bacterium]|nr:LamG domain-containing protein [Polyangiaceae bacterium]
MERKQVRMARTAGAVASLWVVAACASMLGGCSSGNGKTAGGDDRFAAPTADEYTQPLENVVVGTPGGVYRGARLLPDGRIIGGALESNELQRGLAQPNRVDAVVVTSGSNGPGPSASHSTSTVTLTETGTTTAVAPSTSTSRSNAASTSTIVGTGTTSIEFSTSTPAGGFGQWHFDDCSPTSNFLTDASGAGANAQQALGAACVPGISGLGVKIETAKEVVQVPDEPQFTVTNRIGVAAWVNPDTVDGDQPIIIKRLKNDTSFSLGIHNGNIQMSVVTASGTTVISQAPIQAGVWTHVAGMYDGTFVFLFINGQQFGQVYAGEDLHDVFAPIRIGATTGSQSFHGIIDEVFVSTQAISSSTLTALSCIPRPSTVTVAASATGPQPFDTTVHYDVNVADNDVGACGSKFYEFFQNTSSSGFNVSFDSGNVNIITPGESATFGVEIASTEDADPGPNAIFFILDAFEESIFSQEESFNVELDYDVAQPTGCFVTTKRELFITSTSVVDDPVRTFGNTQPGFFAGGGSSSSSSGIVVVDASGPPPPLAAVDASVFDASVGETGVPESSAPASSQGVWSFAHLMREMAPTEDQAPQLVLKLLQLFLSDQQVNGFTVKAKPLMQQDLIDIWPKLANGDL